MNKRLSVMLIVAMVASLFTLPVQGFIQAESTESESLLPNSGLETLNPNNPAMPLGFGAHGQQGVNVQVASVTDVVYAGERAASISGRTVAWTGIQTQIQNVIAEHGTVSYTISAYMKLAAAGAANARISIKIVGNDNSTLQETNLSNSTVITEAWTKVEANLELAGLELADVKNIQVYFNTNSLDSFYIDELHMTKLAEEPGDEDPEEEEPIIGDAVYYVSSANGNDSMGEGTLLSPWRTIQKAADEATAGDTIIIREGVYRETVTPSVGGVQGHPVTFRAYPGEQVVVSGADEVSGWVQDQGNIYRASVAMELGHENQVFWGGGMLFEARWPNAGGFTTDKLLEFNKATMDEGTTSTRIQDSELPNYDWTGGSVWVNSDHRWLSWTGQITGSGNGYLDIVNNADAAGNHLAKAGGDYYIFGVKEALDTEGEWHYDGASLYVWVPGGGNPDNQVEVKRRMYAFDLSGKDYIHLHGLQIHAASVKYNNQSDYNVLDNISLRYLYHSNRAENAYLSQLDTGMMVLGTHNEIRNSEIGYGSGSGVVLKGHDHRVVNSYIHDFNYIGSYAAPLIFNGKRNIVSHNTIHRSGRSVVGRGNDNGGFYDSLLQYNDLGYGGYLTADLGLLYFNAQDGGNSEIRYNWLHDNFAPINQHGLHFDHGVKNMIVHHNVVWGINGNAFRNNMHTNYVLWLNNTGTTTGSNGFGSTWAAAMEMDQHGSQWVNNVTNGGILIQGSNATIYNNETDYSDLVNHRYLTSGTGPVDTAIVLEGINDNYAGQGPDRGAYELGVTPWTAGHDFLSPPVEVDVSRTAVRERNRIVNASFEAAELAPWETVGNQVTLNPFSSFQWDVNKTTLVGHYSARLGSGENEIYQVIGDLEPDTTYEFMAKLRVDAGEQACIGVRDYGDAEVCSDPVTNTNALWQKAVITFRTGEQATSATVYARKLSSGAGSVYVEDTGLQYKDSLNAVLIQAEELARLNPQLPADVLQQLQLATESAREVIEDTVVPMQDKQAAAATLNALIELVSAKVQLLAAVDMAVARHNAAVEGMQAGQYEQGAKAQLALVIEQALQLVTELEVTLVELQQAKQLLEETLDTFLQRVNKTSLSALERVNLISALQELPQWSSQVNAEPQPDGSLKFKAVNKYLGETFRDELFEFDMRYVFNGKSRDWPGFVLRSQKEASSLIWQAGDTAYLIVLKPDQWELQRFVDGAGGIIRTVANTHFTGGEQQTYRIQLGTEDMPGGVRIYLYVDGVRVFDYLDTETPIMLDGYFGFHNGPDTDAITVIGVVQDNFEEPEEPGPGQGNGGGNGSGSGASRIAEVLPGAVATAGLTINRAMQNGSLIDRASLEAQTALKIVEEAVEAGLKQVRVVITDTAQAAADELQLELQEEALNLIARQGLQLVLTIGEVELTLTADALRQLNEREQEEVKDIIFRIRPLQQQVQQDEGIGQAAGSELVQAFAGNSSLILAGKPYVIEANYTGAATRVRLPVHPVHAADQASLAIYVQHSDGDESLQEGEPIYDEQGQLAALDIEVNKFSTFYPIQLDRNLVETKRYTSYMSGYPDGSFQPGRIMTRSELAVVLARLLQDVEAVAPGCEDVKEQHWAYEAVGKVYAAGLMNGKGEGRFDPNGQVSRAELAAIAVRWQQLSSDSEAEPGFTDVASHWARQSIALAQSQGWMNGYVDGSFRPNQGVTRAEAVRVLNLLLERPVYLPDESTWPDVPMQHWAWEDIESAVHSFEWKLYSDKTTELTAWQA